MLGMCRCVGVQDGVRACGRVDVRGCMCAWCEDVCTDVRMCAGVWLAVRNALIIQRKCAQSRGVRALTLDFGGKNERICAHPLCLRALTLDKGAVRACMSTNAPDGAIPLPR